MLLGLVLFCFIVGLFFVGLFILGVFKFAFSLHKNIIRLLLLLIFKIMFKDAFFNRVAHTTYFYLWLDDIGHI